MHSLIDTSKDINEVLIDALIAFRSRPGLCVPRVDEANVTQRLQLVSVISAELTLFLKVLLLSSRC